MSKVDTFKNPDAIHRGTELFMLNDKLDSAELQRQVADMARQGFKSFIARTYVGLKSDYPGADFHDKMRVIVDAARENDMKVFVQAAYMPAGVLELPEAYAHTALRPIKDDIILQPDNAPQPVPESREPSHSAAVLQKRNGISYTLLRHASMLDMLNPIAAAFYTQKSYEEMWGSYREEFGKTIVSVWVDEPHFNPPDLPWTAALPEVFKEIWGYDLTDKIWLLFEDGEGCGSVRYHYWRTVLTLLQKSYFNEISRWCKTNGLWFSGHLMGEETMFGQIGYTCACMPLYRYFDIPGIDYLTSSLHWKHMQPGNAGDGYLFLTTPIQCASAAHQSGKKEILCEMYGVSSQGLTLTEQKYFFDYFASLGINHRMIHGIFYSLKGRAKRRYPPHVNSYQPYWNDYNLLNDYCARVSWFVSQGKPTAEVLVLHPVEGGFMRQSYKKSEEVKRKASSTMRYDRQDRAFNELLQKLTGAHIGYELGDEEIIADSGEVKDGLFVVGQMKYSVVVLPEMPVIRESTLKLLEAFAAAGGRIFVYGALPAMLDGRPFNGERFAVLPGLRQFDDQAELTAALCESIPYILSCDGDAGRVFINRRADDKHQYFYLFNGDQEEPKHITLTVPGLYNARLLHGENGTETDCPAETVNGGTRVNIRIVAGGSAMLLLTAGNTVEVQPPAVRTAAVTRFLGGFSVSRDTSNVLTLDRARFSKPGGSLSPLYPILAIDHLLTKEKYKGEITLEYEIVSDAKLTNLMLALEDAAIQSVTLNGIPADSAPNGTYRSIAFETIALNGTLHVGVNTLRITRHFEPLGKPKISYASLFENLPGVELEAIYLLGDFAANALTEPTDTGCVRLAPYFTLNKENGRCDGELTTAGYPFYAGSIALTKDFTLVGSPNGKTCLRLIGFRGCSAKVCVNGTDAGTVCWAPWEVDIAGLLRAGDNRVTITIAGTLRNLLGPHHRPFGENEQCWSTFSSPDYTWLGGIDIATGAIDEDWLDNRSPGTLGWTESYMVIPFGLKGFEIESEI